MRYTGKDDRRSHVRFTGFELCRVVVNGHEYDGAVVDLSVGGAAIRMDVRSLVQPAAGTPVTLHIERVGGIPAKVVCPTMDGIAVVFRIDQDKEKHLLAALKQLLDDYRSEDS